MKKIFKKVMYVTILSVHALLPCVVHGANLEGTTTKSEIISGVSRTTKKIVFGNGFEYVVKLECSPEVSVYDQNFGKVVYKKTAMAVGEFFNKKKNSPEELPVKILASSLAVTFTYDKQGLIYVSRPEKDIVSLRYKFDDMKWRLKQNHEIFSTKDECIVSQTSKIYRDSAMARHLEYIDNSHLDIICSADGNVSFNSKVY